MSDPRVRRGWLLGAGCEIVAPDGRLLLVEQERQGVVEWAGTGGALEDGESIQDAARRETLEETGLSVRIERLIAVSEFWSGGRLDGVGFLFLAVPEPWPQELRLPEVDGITRFLGHRWVTREEVKEVEPRWPHHITRTAWPPDIERPEWVRIDAPPATRIRRARPVEAEALTALSRRAKAHWGYSADLLARFAGELVVTAEQIERNQVWVLEDADGRIIGFHQVAPGEPAILEDLWVEPEHIGTGQGRVLWEHATAMGRSIGAATLELDADPNAVAFYERMGAERIGETPSTTVAGRALPRTRARLRPPAGE